MHGQSVLWLKKVWSCCALPFYHMEDMSMTAVRAGIRPAIQLTGLALSSEPLFQLEPIAQKTANCSNRGEHAVIDVAECEHAMQQISRAVTNFRVFRLHQQ